MTKTKTVRKTKDRSLQQDENSTPPQEQEHSEISVQEKLKSVRSALSAALVEREPEIDLVLTAMLCREHCLFIGDPGTAKSALLYGLASGLSGCKVFPLLLNKFSTPEEVFGPISVTALKEDKYKRITTGKLPETHFFLCEEIFKASTAILNTMLRVLNERVFEDGEGSLIKCPLLMCLAASNEWPNDENGGEELGALFDRFLFRKTVRAVSRAGRRILLAKAVDCDPCRPSYPSTISLSEIKTAHREAMELPWHSEAKKALWDILEQLNKDGIFPGDRRTYKAVAAARANAYLLGGKEVLPCHLEVLTHVLWNDPAEQPMKCERIVARIANPLGVRIFDLLQQAQDVEAQTEEQLKDVTRAEQREGAIQTVLIKLDEIQKELSILKQDERRDKALSYIDDAIRDWRYKLIRADRRGS